MSTFEEMSAWREDRAWGQGVLNDRIGKLLDALEAALTSAEEAKAAWLQACDDAGHLALQVEELEEQGEKVADLERRLDLIQSIALGGQAPSSEESP